MAAPSVELELSTAGLNLVARVEKNRWTNGFVNLLACPRRFQPSNRYGPLAQTACTPQIKHPDVRRVGIPASLRVR